MLPTSSAAKPAGASPLLASLVAYWKLDEASGTRSDSHGSCHLTDNNTVTQAGGKLANAAQFTRANSEYLSLADNASMSTGDIDFTVQAWVYLDSKPVNMFIVAKDNGSPREYRLDYVQASDRFRFFAFTSSDSVAGIVSADSLGAPATGTWYHLLAWHDATANTVSIQVNGGTVDAAGTVGVPSDTAASLWIGAENGTNHFFDGRIDEVAFWKRTLTSGERSSLYAAGAGLEYPFS